MKIKNLIILTVLTSGIMASCNKKPAAAFSIDDETPLTGQNVHFTSETVNGVTYDWDFGDGNQATGETSSHIYANPGSYTITLTAFSKKEKKSDAVSKTITVSPNTFELATVKWNYNTIRTINYKNGAIIADNTTDLAGAYDIHTLEFFENHTFETILDELTTLGNWSLNAEETILTAEGVEYQITEITSTVLNFVSTDLYTDGGDVYKDSTFTYLSR